MNVVQMTQRFFAAQNDSSEKSSGKYPFFNGYQLKPIKINVGGDKELDFCTNIPNLVKQVILHTCIHTAELDY